MAIFIVIFLNLMVKQRDRTEKTGDVNEMYPPLWLETHHPPGSVPGITHRDAEPGMLGTTFLDTLTPWRSMEEVTVNMLQKQHEDNEDLSRSMVIVQHSAIYYIWLGLHGILGAPSADFIGTFIQTVLINGCKGGNTLQQL